MPTSREEALGVFANVDLGGNKTMERIVRNAKAQRDAIIEECALEAESCNAHAAATKIRRLKEI